MTKKCVISQTGTEKKGIIELPLKFKKYGKEFEQIEKGKNYYVYRINDAPIYYEVFKRKTTSNFYNSTLNKWESSDCMERVKYPSDESFGNWAWCCRTLKRVEEIKAMFNYDSKTQK